MTLREGQAPEPWLTVQQVRNIEDAPLLQNARQALWDVYLILGFDTDGEATPRSVPDVEALVVQAAKEFRAEADKESAPHAETLAALRAVLDRPAVALLDPDRPPGWLTRARAILGHQR